MQLGIPVVLGELPFALLAAVALAAFPLALLTALFVIWLFRRAVARSMAATGGAGKTVEPAAITTADGQGELEIERVDVRSARPAAGARPALAYLRRERRRAVWRYVAATGSWSLVLALLLTVTSSFSPADAGMLKTAILVLSFTLSLATPVVLAATMVISRRVSAMSLAVLLLLLAICAVDRLIGTDGLGLWALMAGVPTAAILLLSTRRLRSIGPIVYAAWMMFLFCAMIGPICATLYLLDLIGPVSFVREDLAQLPFPEALDRFLAELFAQPASQLQASISGFASDPLSVIHVANLDRLPPAAPIWLIAIGIGSALVGAMAAWQFMRWYGLSYRSRRASDQMLTTDVIIVLFTAPLVLAFIGMGAPVLALFAVGGFICYRILAHRGIRWWRGAAAQVESSALLLLRPNSVLRGVVQGASALCPGARCIGASDSRRTRGRRGPAHGDADRASDRRSRREPQFRQFVRCLQAEIGCGGPQSAVRRDRQPRRQSRAEFH